jgi:hypothetical protein
MLFCIMEYLKDEVEYLEDKVDNLNDSEDSEVDISNELPVPLHDAFANVDPLAVQILQPAIGDG